MTKRDLIPYVIYGAISYGFTFSMYYMDMKLQTNSLRYVILTNLFLLLLLISYQYYRNKNKGNKIRNLYKNGILNDSLLGEIDCESSGVILNVYNDFQDYKGSVRQSIDEERDFITKWIHDIKVPLSAVRLIIEDSTRVSNSSGYPDIDKELKNLEDCIKKMFYIMKTNRFSDDYKIDEVQTKAIISGALKEYSTFFSYKGLCLAMSGEDYSVVTDSKWCGYIISEIVSNAIKYTPEKGTISIETFKDENETAIVIRNSGEGIREEDLVRVFNKGFTAIDRQGLKSTGYGLYLAKKISGLLGHRIEVKSTFGEGAEFSLYFTNQDNVYNLAKM